MLPGIVRDSAPTSASQRSVDWYTLWPFWLSCESVVHGVLCVGGGAPATKKKGARKVFCLGTSRGTAGARRGARAPPANILLKNSSQGPCILLKNSSQGPCILLKNSS